MTPEQLLAVSARFGVSSESSAHTNAGYSRVWNESMPPIFSYPRPHRLRAQQHGNPTTSTCRQMNLPLEHLLCCPTLLLPLAPSPATPHPLFTPTPAQRRPPFAPASALSRHHPLQYRYYPFSLHPAYLARLRRSTRCRLQLAHCLRLYQRRPARCSRLHQRRLAHRSRPHQRFPVVIRSSIGTVPSRRFPPTLLVSAACPRCRCRSAHCSH
jgi:hypothetical protein